MAAQKPHGLVQKEAVPVPGCKGVDPFKTELYIPFEYKGQCMNPPLVPNLESCPIDERRMLSDGTTVAIKYPAKGFNCNPYKYGGIRG